jgi:hypothetical protein
MIKKELEELTGKLLDGDMTDVVINLFKDSKDKNELLKFTSLVTDETLKRELIEIANKRRAAPVTSQESNSRLSIEVWAITAHHRKNSRGLFLRLFLFSIPFLWPCLKLR